jgi:hypothetical protein
MNIRQAKYKKNRLAGMNQYNAARAAGYSEAYSRNAKPEKIVKGCMADAFEQAGLTDKAIVAHALEGLIASKTVSAVGGKDAGAGTFDFIDVPDWGNRHKYFETILKLTERMKEKAAIEINQYMQMWNGIQKKAQDVEDNGRVHITDKKEVPA